MRNSSEIVPSGHATPLVVNDLVKTYGSHAVVNGISFSVDRGEVFGLLGPNGAGKTTTVEILTGMRSASAGTVQVLGVDPATADRAWRDRVGVVFQDGTDHGDWRVGELVAQFARGYSKPLEPLDVLEAVSLADCVRTRVDRLSGGQRRRLDVALGIVGRPDVLFLDEPTTGLDPEARRSLWELIQRLAQRGTTILLTTHYLDEASHLADRLCVLKAGEVLEISTPAELGRRHAAAVISWRGAGGPESVRTDDAAVTLKQLESKLGGPLPDLQIHRPSLEDRYLAVIGEDR
ncbi:ABC transporter ATP-binding protein [Kitasatospora sp. NPDC004669]|uniref:ABC transporter ATP-binding protein n=1 Tax=Kitasatospora sp. NPDC004669 TaxID=3154555 RepID=UPI0033B79FE7